MAGAVMPISRAIPRSDTLPTPSSASWLRAAALISASVADRCRSRRDAVSVLIVTSLLRASSLRWLTRPHDVRMVNTLDCRERRVLQLTTLANTVHSRDRHSPHYVTEASMFARLGS